MWMMVRSVVMMVLAVVTRWFGVMGFWAVWHSQNLMTSEYKLVIVYYTISNDFQSSLCGAFTE